MRQFSEWETLKPEALQGLRSRVVLRRLTVVLVVAFVALLFGSMALPAHAAGVVSLLAAGVFVGVAFSVLTLLFSPCPRCQQRFSERSIVNFMFFPSPTAFGSSCASCGVPLSKAS